MIDASQEQGFAPEFTQTNLDYWQDLLTIQQRRILQGLITAWLLVSLIFWIWWFQPAHQLTLLGTFLTSSVLGIELLLPGYFFYFIL